MAPIRTMEIDHLFICVKLGGSEAKEIAEFGLNEGSANRYPGQGTANRRFFFHNAFIELLWLEDTGEAKSRITQPTYLFEHLRLPAKKLRRLVSALDLSQRKIKRRRSQVVL